METKKFGDLSNTVEGLVFLGCGGDLQDWVDGIDGELKQFCELNCFDEKFLLETTGGRHDIVVPFNEKLMGKIPIGRLAMWRIQFCLNCHKCSWISDYVNNYADHHGCSPISLKEADHTQPQEEEKEEPKVLEQEEAPETEKKTTKKRSRQTTVSQDPPRRSERLRLKRLREK